MSPALDDAAFLHDDNEVGVFNCRQAVGDDEGSPSTHQSVHGFLDYDLSSCVDAGSSLVEYEHRRVLDHGPGNGEKLLLA